MKRIFTVPNRVKISFGQWPIATTKVLTCSRLLLVKENLVITMTGQIANQFKYEGEIYQLVAYTGESLYTAEDFGITTQSASTACWRGYQSFYDCVNGELILDALHVHQ